MRCSQVEKMHMVDLIREFQYIVKSIPTLKPEEKPKVAERLRVISREMSNFRSRYPDD